jgi:hypothetical protein
VTGFLILGQAACWDTVERDDHSCRLGSKGQNLGRLGLMHSRKVVLLGGMLALGSIVAVAVHSTG